MNTLELPPLVRRTTFKSLAYDGIKRLLTTGQLQRKVLYSAQQLAEKLNVSRTPVREALLQLTAEGFLTGVEVKGFKVHEFTRKEIQDFFEIRKMIEPYIVERLAPVVPAPILQQLSESLSSMETHAKAGRRAEFLEADKAFHHLLFLTHANAPLESFMDKICDQIAILGFYIIDKRGRVDEVLREHRKIVDGLSACDPKSAALAVLHHLNTTEQDLLEKFP